MFHPVSSSTSNSTKNKRPEKNSSKNWLLASTLLAASQVLHAEEEVADVDPNALTPWPWPWLEPVWTTLTDLIYQFLNLFF